MLREKNNKIINLTSLLNNNLKYTYFLNYLSNFNTKLKQRKYNVLLLLILRLIFYYYNYYGYQVNE